MNVVQTLNNRNNTANTKLYTPYVTCVSHLWQDNVRKMCHRSAFAQTLLQCKSRSITYSECVSVAFVIQHTKPMHHTTLYFHLWPPTGVSHFFPHCPIHSTIFGKMSLNTRWVFWFFLQLLSDTFLILRSKGKGKVIPLQARCGPEGG